MSKPGPRWGTCTNDIATMSQVASPVDPSPPLVLPSSPCPHSWYMTSAISPVLLQPPPLRKKLVDEPFQNALQTSGMLTLVRIVDPSQAMLSHLEASDRERFWWKKALRSAGVENPLPRMSVPPVPRLRSP